MVGAGAGVIAAGVVGALVLSLALKPSTPIDHMVPDDAGLYATIYLDPSLPQKANLLRMAHRFPDLQTDQQLTAKVNEWLDRSLEDSGLSYTKDVQPWLGSRATLVGDLSNQPTWAMLLASRDDAGARAALARMRTSTWGKTNTWRDATYQGVAIAIGSDKKTTTVYAFFDHTAVLAGSESWMHTIIDTDQGRHGGLLQAADFQATQALLPSDRLVLAYISGPRLVQLLKSQASTQLKASTVTVPDSAWGELSAFRGIGMSLSAGPDGLSGDVEVRIDPSKLDASIQHALAQSSRRNALLAWVPERAFGVLASNDVKSGIQSALDQASPTMDAQTRESLQQFGLLGDKGVIAHLTGDMVMEVEAPAAKKLGGAILIGTSDAAGMQAFLTQLGTLAALGDLSGGPGAGSSALSVHKSTYKGVTITSFPISGLQSPDLVPSIAVAQGVGIVASSPAEIRSLIDAHHAGKTIAQAHNFAAVAAATFSDPQSFLYVDVTALTDAVLSYVPAADRRTYDTARTNLTPVKAFMVASHQQSDRLSERVFVLIPN